jgi:hypothetical protein
MDVVIANIGKLMPPRRRRRTPAKPAPFHGHQQHLQPRANLFFMASFG